MKCLSSLLLLGASLLPHVSASFTPARRFGALHNSMSVLKATKRVATHLQKRISPHDKKVIIQMFQWNYESVGDECQNFIGPAGYGYVEVGGLSEHINGTSWWTSYQTVSYRLTSKYGTAEQFAEMTRKCRDAGVGVLVDVIVNHMTGSDTPSVGFAGSNFSHYEYPGIYTKDNFHHCSTPNNDIVDWNSLDQRWNCELVNLADLDTSQPYVRGKVADYLNALIDLGAAGFRVDAASLIEPREMAQIYGLLKKKVYISQEAPGAPNYLDIAKNGDNQEFQMVDWTAKYFGKSDGDLSELWKIKDGLKGWTPADQAVVFIANHDRERGNALTYKAPEILSNAHVFMLGWNYGNPQVLSSYQFSNKDAGGPNGMVGTCQGGGGANGWNCQHRWDAIVGMVRFYNGAQGQDINAQTKGSKQQFAWGRGKYGFVAINNEAKQVWTHTFKTELPDGDYCDILHGKRTGQNCPGTKYTVKKGSFTVAIPARSSIAIITDEMVVPILSVEFSVVANTNWGQNLFVVGSIPQLGNWDPSKAIKMDAAKYPQWTAHVSQIPGNAEISYKYIKMTESGPNSVEWEPLQVNRQLATGGGIADVTRTEIWGTQS